MKPAKATNRITKTSTVPNAVVKQPQPAVSSRSDVLFKRETILTARTSTAPNGTKEIQRATSPAPETTIKAKIDVGFGNNLFVRGQGAGLSWERGVPLTCVDGQTWQWSGKADDRLTFKLLLNDSVWAKGEDIIAKQGVLDQGLDFIGKPYRPSELGAKVRAILDRKLSRAKTADPNRAAS